LICSEKQPEKHQRFTYFRFPVSHHWKERDIKTPAGARKYFAPVFAW